MLRLVLEKAEEPETKLPTSAGSWKKQESSGKTSISALLTMARSLTVWITINCGKFWKRWEYQTTWSASWEICMQVKKQQVRSRHGTTDWFQIGKGVRQGCILSPCLFNFYTEYIMQNARLDESQTEIKISGRNINHFRYAYDTILMTESEEEQRAPWWRWKRRVKKLAWNSTLKKTKIMASSPIISWQIEGEKVEVVTYFIFLGSKITADGGCRWWLQPWN